MEIVDQSLNHDLPVFPTFPATADMISKFTFNHRFPSLSINAIQAGSFHPFGPGLPFRIRQLPSPSNRRDKVGFSNPLSVESSICYCKPGIETTVLSSPSACHASKVRQKLTVASGTLARPDSQNELRGGAHSEDPLAPGTISPTRSALVIGTFRAFSESSGVKADDLLLHPKGCQKGVIHLLQLGLSEPPVSSTEGTMVWDILQSQFFTYPPYLGNSISNRTSTTRKLILRLIFLLHEKLVCFFL